MLNGFPVYKINQPWKRVLFYFLVLVLLVHKLEEATRVTSPAWRWDTLSLGWLSCPLALLSSGATQSVAPSPEVSLGSSCDWQKFNQVVSAVPTTGKVGLALLLRAMVRLRVTTGHFECWALRCDLRESSLWHPVIVSVWKVRRYQTFYCVVREGSNNEHLTHFF